MYSLQVEKWSRTLNAEEKARARGAGRHSRGKAKSSPGTKGREAGEKTDRSERDELI